jgi:pimeloyl-ACP methyl ester carboxylesterase
MRAARCFRQFRKRLVLAYAVTIVKNTQRKETLAMNVPSTIAAPPHSVTEGDKRKKFRFIRWLIRGILGLMLLIVTLAVSGTVYETLMAGGDAQRFPPPGQLVSVNGHQMHIYCVGEGSPTVILEAGFGDWSDTWTLVQPELGKTTRVCSYDRAGLGWSEASSESRSPHQIAEELHTLLLNSGNQPPYILVGHSLGGKHIRLFNELYPDEVAGMVFVDARHESMEPVGRTAEENQRDREAYEASFGLHRTLRQMGIVRLFGAQLAPALNPALSALPSDVLYRLAMFSVRETTIQTLLAESPASMDDDDLLITAQVRADLPIVVLTADSSLQIDGWEAAQKRLVALSENSQWIVVEDSRHHIQYDQPQVFVEAVTTLIEAVR